MNAIASRFLEKAIDCILFEITCEPFTSYGWNMHLCQNLFSRLESVIHPRHHNLFLLGGRIRHLLTLLNYTVGTELWNSIVCNFLCWIWFLTVGRSRALTISGLTSLDTLFWFYYIPSVTYLEIRYVIVLDFDVGRTQGNKLIFFMLFNSTAGVYFQVILKYIFNNILQKSEK